MRLSLNNQTLLIATGHPRQSYVGIALDIAGMLTGDTEPRLVPVMSNGGGTDSLRDLLLLRGVDLALVSSNVLADPGASQILGETVKQQIAYVARLYSEELHVVAGRGVASLEDLRGKKLAVPVADGNTRFAIGDVLKRLGIAAELVAMEPADAVDLIRSGDLVAMVLIGGKPLPFVSRLPKDGSLQLVKLSAVPALGEGYAPAGFSASDYPTLIPPGDSIETIAISAVIMAKTTGSPQVPRFVRSFFHSLTEQAGGHRHPKWGEVNLGATVPGWSRFRPAQEWLDDAKRQQAEWLQKRFAEFLRNTGNQEARTSPEERQRLFDAFLKWSRGSVEPSATVGRP